MVDGNQSAQADIRKRSFDFAVRILRLVRALPREPGLQVVTRQLARSGTSVGANIEEAQGSQSRKESARRMNIARSEAREAFYWLRLLAEAKLVPRSRLDAITREAEEIVRILVAIVKTMRAQR